MASTLLFHRSTVSVCVPARPSHSPTIHSNTSPKRRYSLLHHHPPPPPPIRTRTRARAHIHIQSHRHETQINLNAAVEDEEEAFKTVKEEEDVTSTSQNNKPTATTETDKMNSVNLLKAAAKTRKVPVSEVVSAFGVLRKAKLDASNFLSMLGGTESPGRTWMLIFTAQGRSGKGFYFPLTAVQRFDAAARRIENGIYLGPIGCFTFEGRFSWKRQILTFIFESLNVKIGPLSPLKINLAKEEDKGRTPVTKDPFFIWFYVDEEIAIAQGRGGGTALWCRYNIIIQSRMSFINQVRSRTNHHIILWK